MSTPPTPATSFTAGNVIIASPGTTPVTPCPSGVTGLSVDTCAMIASGEAADLTNKVFGPGAPPIPLTRDVLPGPVRTLLDGCEGLTPCKFVAYDFDTSTGQSSVTRSHLISTQTTTAHNAGVFVKNGVDTLPLFKTIPGYNFDGMFSFNPDSHAPLVAATSVVDERYCARACDEKPSCGGFNYEPLTRMCTLFPKGKKNVVYKDGRVSFSKDVIATAAAGSNPVGTDLTGTGAWCGVQNLTQCNADISDVITNNPEILSFTTSDLASCSACPAKTVARTSASTWAVSNEIDTTTISTTSADTIAKLQYTTRTTPTVRTTLTPGNFYKLTPYLPGSSFETRTCLYMKRIKKFEVVDQPEYRYWTMNGTAYSITGGTYLTTQFIEALNAAGTPGMFSFDGKKITWVGEFAVVNVAGPLGLAGFVDKQETEIDSVTGLESMSGWDVSYDDVSGGFFTHGQYTQQVRIDNGGMCEEVGNTYNGGNAAKDQLPDVDGRATRIFGALGSDFTNMTLEYSSATLEPMPVDYVTNGFLLRNPTTGKYFPASKWQRPVWNEPVLRERNTRNYGAYQSNDQPVRCSVVPTDPSYGSGEMGDIVTEWGGENFYEGCSRDKGTSLPEKYKAAYNAFVFIITPATYAEFYDEATASVPDQPLIIKRPNEPIPYIFNPGTEDLRVLRFPTQSSFDTHLAAHPSWAKYYSPYKSVGKFRYMTLKEAENCGAPAVGGPGGSYAFEEVTHDPWPQLTVYDENFWNTVPYDDRFQISDPTYGCADPPPAVYIGGEYQKTVGTITFCVQCPAGTYSPVTSAFETSCTPCAQGTYCLAGSGAEKQCAAGYYCPTPAEQIECPAGSYCPASTANHIPCVAGDYCPAKSVAKQDCPAGSYCPTPAQKIQCPAGSYCSLRVTTHTPCVDATRPTTSFYCPPGTRTLNECPAGYSCSGNSVATRCPAGFYCPNGSSVPIQCPTNTTYVPLGLANIIAISQLNQAQVLDGIFTGGSTCYSCPIVNGVQTTADSARTSCTCPAPLVWQAWTNECLPACPKGQSANAAKTGCETCGDNTYTPVDNLARCIPCANNVPGAPAVHDANKTGCVCNGTITGGSYTWNSTWNRCRTVCNSDHLAYWGRCYAQTARASPISYTAPDAVPYYECPNESQNAAGRYASTTMCTKGSNKKTTTAGGLICNFSCPSNWTKNGGGNWNDQPCTRNLSCYRSSIITKYECPTCWKPKYYQISGGQNTCPPGYSSSQGTSDCDILPTTIKDLTSVGIPTGLIGAICIWNGNTNPVCGTCPVIPDRGYTGPTVDETRFPTGMKMKCTMSNAPATPDPWGADGASPMLDASGNIMLPSLVTLTLQAILPPPAGNSNIPCLRGSYMVNAPGTTSATQADGSVAVGPSIVPGQVLPGTCAPCPQGTFCDAGYSTPYVCPPGTYCSSPSNFRACTSGERCEGGSAMPTMCPPKYYCPSTFATPIICPAGKYCPGPGSPAGYTATAPLDCNTGEYCPEGSSEHSMCPAGSYCTTPSVIAQCPAGSYCPSGTSVPRPCEPGNYCPVGSKVATPCTLGNYCAASSSTQTPCNAGYYCPDPATRVACPAGKYSALTGQTAPTACLICPEGTTCPYDGASTLFPNPNITPIRCATGYFCPAGSATFNACPNGWYCPTSSQKIQCVVGAVCPTGTIAAGVPTPNQRLVTNGAESCRRLCARGTGLPQAWVGAICVDTYTVGTTCETINGSPVECNCQQSLGFGWSV